MTRTTTVLLTRRVSSTHMILHSTSAPLTSSSTALGTGGSPSRLESSKLASTANCVHEIRCHYMCGLFFFYTLSFNNDILLFTVTLLSEIQSSVPSSCTSVVILVIVACIVLQVMDDIKTEWINTPIYHKIFVVT